MNNMKIKTLNGHLTAFDKRAIKELFNKSLMSGMVNRKTYFIEANTDATFKVKVVVNEKNDYGFKIQRSFISNFLIQGK